MEHQARERFRASSKNAHRQPSQRQAFSRLQASVPMRLPTAPRIRPAACAPPGAAASTDTVPSGRKRTVNPACRAAPSSVAAAASTFTVTALFAESRSRNVDEALQVDRVELVRPPEQPLVGEPAAIEDVDAVLEVERVHEGANKLDVATDRCTNLCHTMDGYVTVDTVSAVIGR